SKYIEVGYPNEQGFGFNARVEDVRSAADLSAEKQEAPSLLLTEQQRKDLLFMARTLNDPILDSVERENYICSWVESFARLAVRAALRRGVPEGERPAGKPSEEQR